MSPIRAAITGAGVLAPGLDGWTKTRAVLSGESPWERSLPSRPGGNLLPPVERRRASETTRYAMHVAQQALDMAQLEHARVRTVFSTVSGESEISHQICETLAQENRDLSPIKFHNSVHNAPMGYWAIATQCQAPSTALACFDGSFAAGLLEAAVQVACEGEPTLFISCDPPHCLPVQRLYPIPATCAIALLLSPMESEDAIGTVSLTLGSDSPSALPSGALSPLAEMMQGNPTGRGMALLHALALATPASKAVTLAYLRHTELQVVVTSC